MFEDGLPKEECRMENHEMWWPTFTVNSINILVRDLVKKIKALERPLADAIRKAEDKASMRETKFNFVYNFIDIQLKEIKVWFRVPDVL
eukprot:Gb_11968 [translate_table: standard]